MKVTLNQKDNTINIEVPLQEPKRSEKEDKDGNTVKAKHALIGNSGGWVDVGDGDQTIQLDGSDDLFRLRGSILIGFKPEEPIRKDSQFKLASK